MQDGITSIDGARLSHDLLKLEAEIQTQLRGRVREFELFTSEDGLILRGEADCFYDKQLALHMVRQETDLPISANQIAVSSRERTSDSKL